MNGDRTPVIVGAVRIPNAEAGRVGRLRGALQVVRRKGVRGYGVQEAAARLFQKSKHGKYGGIHAVDAAAYTIERLLEQHPNVPAEVIEEVRLGCVTQADEQATNIAKLVAAVAGLPEHTAGSTHTRLCASGLEALTSAHACIGQGWAEVVIAGGVEMMTSNPMGWDNLVISDRMRERVPVFLQHQGAHNIAKRYRLQRRELDAYSVRSQARYARALEDGKFAGQIVAIEHRGKHGSLVKLDRDEHARNPFPKDGSHSLSEADWPFEEWFNKGVHRLSKLPPAFGLDTIHAGNSSGLVDGAAMHLMMTAQKARELGARPLATIRANAVAGSDPELMLTGPIPATEKALQQAQLSIDDIDVVLINEAFAAVPMAFMSHFGLDPAKVNPWGGAIAFGHPLGATGAILGLEALWHLQEPGVKRVLITMCVGFSQGQTVILESL